MEAGGNAPDNVSALKRLVRDNWAQAKADATTALTLRDAGIYYASVFFAQQAAEKALKSAILHKRNKNPRGHNLITFANELSAPLEIMNAAGELNFEFLSSRNPEHAEGVPAQIYDIASANLHLAASAKIVEWARQLL
ncbi:MAG: HEPN domain-containing protein [Fibrella sp.]|nr:HEPN domain-containing protein [Armatimonadota bacterium]